MFKLTCCLLSIFIAVTAKRSFWSVIDTAWHDLNDAGKAVKNIIYPALPNSLELPPDALKINQNGGCDSIYNCADCYSVQICQPTKNGTYLPFRNTTCPKNTPYCSSITGTCSSIPDPNCGTPDQFACPTNGYFPDSTNCSIYHACNDYQSNTFICGARNYDPDSKTCMSNVPCQSADCTGKSGKKVAIGTSTYFAYCISGLAVMVDRCIGDYKLNYTSQDCEPRCVENGLLTDYLDCNKYYKCSTMYLSPGNSIMLREHLSCQLGYAYDPSNIMCMPLKNTNCSQINS